MSAAPIAAGRRPAFGITRLDVAVVAFAVSAAIMAWGLSVSHGRTWALLSLLPMLAAIGLRRNPLWAGVCVGVSATALRLAYIGIGSSTQVDHARNAAARAIDGLSPYGILIASSTAPPEPYVYGPAGLLWWQPGIAVEFLAAMGVTALLITTRSWLTLAVYSGLPFAIFLTTTGVNDYSPGLLIAAGLLLLPKRPVLGGGILALAAAIKPYAFAWFLPAIGFAGWPVAMALVAGTVVLWSPLLVWGPASFLRSIQLNATVHPVAENALNLPGLRWLAIPLAAAGLFTRRWEAAVLSGAAVFVTYLFFGRWASLGYWVAVIPAAGIAIEQGWSRG